MVGRGKGQEWQKWISRFVVSNHAEDFTAGRYSSEENWIWSWNAETASPSENVCVGTDSWKCSKTRPGYFRGRYFAWWAWWGDHWGAMGVVGLFLLVVVAVDHPLWIWCSEGIFYHFVSFSCFSEHFQLSIQCERGESQFGEEVFMSANICKYFSRGTKDKLQKNKYK